ncbi:CynX/NimT family MFS transporter [Cellulomonas sp. PhB143]|uniref:MFS transporter n=1 Tax=Cellulomonas sp. PhB143 TaxID=2485186 RepID=UPI0013151331|nr:MFS transporter [Cellulomonas sp. PhB143]
MSRSAEVARDVPPASPWRGRTVVLVGIVLVALNLRIAVTAVSPVLDTVRADIPMSEAQAGLLGTVPVLTFALFGALTPAVSRRLGMEVTVVVSLLVSSMGEVVRATTGSAGGFLAWSVLALAGMGMGNVLMPPLVKRYFPDRVGAVTAAYTITIAISTTVPPLFVVAMTDDWGWRPALASWAAVGLVAVVPWVVVVVRSAAARSALAPVLEHTSEHTPGLDGRERGTGRVRRSPLAWGLTAMFGANSLNTYFLFAWLPQILADAGLSESAAAQGLALYAVVGIPTSLAAPVLAARMRRPFWLVVLFVALMVVGYAGLAVAPETGTMVWVVAVGLGAATFPLGLALIGLRTRTSAGAVALSGFVQGFGYVVASAGPLLAGVLHGASGSWTTTYLVMGATLAVVLVGGAVGARDVRLEDQWLPERPDGADGTDTIRG